MLKPQLSEVLVGKMIGLLWSLLAAGLASFMEVVYRQSDTFPVWLIVPAVALSYALYRTVHGGPSFMMALVAFSAFTICIRALASVFLFHETLVRGNLVALFAFVVAMGARYWK